MLGEVIGSYRVLRQLGAGGMGVVYLAQHAVIGRYAALKLLLPEFSADPEIVARFFNEARTAALIRHPGLVDVYDFGRLPDGSAYLVMEYRTGETLSALLARSGHLPLDLALALGRQIALAVGAAHQKGIVHRDLKPDNVFVVPDDEVPVGVRARILDFGIAKLSADLQDNGVQTKTGSFIGTPVYMSPEQCRGARSVDGRSDIYSLGCILFEMTTGKRPFSGEGMGEIIGAHQYLPPPAPSQVEPSVPPWLDAIILKALAKRPEDRFATMEELAAALGARARPSAAEVTQMQTAVVQPISTVRRGAGEISGPASLPPQPKRKRWIGVAVVGAALGVGAAAFGIRSAQTLTPTPTLTPAPPAPAPAPPPPDIGDGGRTWRVAGIAAAATGVVLVAGGVYFGLRAKSKADQLDALQRGDMWDQELYDSGKAAERNMFIFLGAGAAAVATGAVLYFVTGKSPPVDTAVVPTAGGAGVVVWRRS